MKRKYYKEDHFVSVDKETSINIRWYTTGAGYLKFNIQVFRENLSNGFCWLIAEYNTSSNALLRFLESSPLFTLTKTVSAF